ncbi:MAG: GGDEF domain-containing protein [Magnetococcales bacterium]|nr:GGDEF domain-containing protein [Magnetococcales bacterium]
MFKTGIVDFSFESQFHRSYGNLVARVIEQQAELADHRLNEQLLKALIQEFVESERQLAEAHRLLLSISRTDALTGIANRRWFDEVLASEWNRALRSGGKVGLLLMDIDSFKLFNDNYGHPAGDDCLRQVARAVQGVVHRSPDLAARYGGEELVCVLPDTDLDGVGKVGQEVLEAIRALQIPHVFSKVPDGIVTVSIGGASLHPAPGSDPEELVKCADTMLYHSKGNGRNRLTLRT